jgi:ketosteroid isomerase-like protein
MEKNMMYFIKVVILSLLICPSVFAQSSSEVDIEKLMNSLSQAIISADQKALDNLTTNDLIYGHSDDRLQNKTEFIDSLVNKKSVMTKIDLSNQKITIVGDLAFVSNHMSADVAPGGKPGHVELNIFYVWKKSGDSWKLIARKAFKG